MFVVVDPSCIGKQSIRLPTNETIKPISSALYRQTRTSRFEHLSRLDRQTCEQNLSTSVQTQNSGIIIIVVLCGHNCLAVSQHHQIKL